MYVWNAETATFAAMRGMDEAGLTLAEMQEYAENGGISETAAGLRRILYGENEIQEFIMKTSGCTPRI